MNREEFLKKARQEAVKNIKEAFPTPDAVAAEMVNGVIEEIHAAGRKITKELLGFEYSFGRLDLRHGSATYNRIVEILDERVPAIFKEVELPPLTDAEKKSIIEAYKSARKEALTELAAKKGAQDAADFVEKICGPLADEDGPT